MGNAHTTNRLQIAPYSNPQQSPINNPNDVNNMPFYGTYHPIRQMVPSSYHHQQQQQQQQSQQHQINENIYMRNQPLSQLPPIHHSHAHPQLTQLPQLPLLHHPHHKISTHPMEQQQQQQQHYHHQQHSYIHTLQKGSDLNYIKNDRKNQDKHKDALVGLILPTKNSICNSNSNNNNNANQINSNSNSNSKENTLRRTNNIYSSKYQTHLSKQSKQQQQLPEIMLEKTSSSEYFFSNRDEKKKQQRKKLLTCRSQETGANIDEINKDSKSESNLTTKSAETTKIHQKSSRFEKYNDRNKFKLQKTDMSRCGSGKQQYNQQNQPYITNMRKSRSQHKINKKPSFNSKISIKQRQQQREQEQMKKESATAEDSTTANTEDDGDEEEYESESNYETINKIDDKPRQRPHIDYYDNENDNEFNSSEAHLQHPPPPPPPPPLSEDAFKQSDPNLFDRLKKVKKLPAVGGQFDEKASKSFDAVVNELKTKLSRIKTNEAAAAASQKMSDKSKETTTSSAFSSVSAYSEAPTVPSEMASHIKSKMNQMSNIKNKHSSKVFQNNQNDENNYYNINGVNIEKFFKPVVTKEALSRIISNDSLKIAKIKNIIKKPTNSLNGSTTNTEQTTSEPNMDLTQMSTSSLSSHLNRNHRGADTNNNNNNNINFYDIHPKLPALPPPNLGRREEEEEEENHQHLKKSIPVSSSTYIDKMPKEISASNTKIINSVANSFKLELFENVNSDEDSDDYTKYNRVKFSPTAIEPVITTTIEPIKLESEINDSSSPATKLLSSNPNSKSISFSFKSKSNELLKKIQKRNTFASHPKAEIIGGGVGTSDKFSLIEETTLNTANNNDSKLYKSKSAHVKKVSVEKSLTLKSINLDEEMPPSNDQQQQQQQHYHHNRKSNINFIKVSPRVKSIAAFSTRNLFRNFETSSPSEKVNVNGATVATGTSSASEFTSTSNNINNCNSLLTPIETSTDSMKIQDFKAKIYDNLMKSITHACVTNIQIKNEFKPHIVHHLNSNTTNVNNNNEIKMISLKSSCGTNGLNKSETCKEILKSKLASLSNEIKCEMTNKTGTNTPSSTIASVTATDSASILNSKSVGQIPSKYSSFTDYNKNKSLTKLNEIIAANANNKTFISTTIPRDWKIINNAEGCFYDEDLYDYGHYGHMQPYEYAPKYLNFNYFSHNEDSSDMNLIGNSQINTNVTTAAAAASFQQQVDSKSQRLNDYLVEMTNYYRNFNKMATTGAENNTKV